VNDLVEIAEIGIGDHNPPIPDCCEPGRQDLSACSRPINRYPALARIATPAFQESRQIGDLRHINSARSTMQRIEESTARYHGNRNPGRKVDMDSGKILRI
jgi:hypothetical protein